MKSTAPGICNGDIVIVHKQADAENGDIIVATINGDDATCKRLQKHNDHLELKPDNEKYSPFLFTPEQVEKMPVRIIGKVVEVRRKV
ncbi:MAG: hypothetical protein LIP02_13755 [Bacteroidales bacterium]|nr:hypothetical protein [Bacteroidales bacterium]MCC8177383.1 hypothetical protein [Bacteroidales bacterium]